MDRRQKKSVQAVNYLASKREDKSLNKIKAIKLLWIADKYHLLKYGRTILKDNYFAMKHGPVPCQILNLIDGANNNEYISTYITTSGFSLKAKKETDFSLFSKSDIEVFDLVWEKFSDLDKWVLRDLTHFYPEWKKFEADILDPKKPNRYDMNIEDFYNIPENNEKNKSNFFLEIPSTLIEESKRTNTLRKKFESA